MAMGFLQPQHGVAVREFGAVNVARSIADNAKWYCVSSVLAQGSNARQANI